MILCNKKCRLPVLSADSSVGRAVDCRGKTSIHRSPVRFRVSGKCVTNSFLSFKHAACTSTVDSNNDRRRNRFDRDRNGDQRRLFRNRRRQNFQGNRPPFRNFQGRNNFRPNRRNNSNTFNSNSNRRFNNKMPKLACLMNYIDLDDRVGCVTVCFQC